MDDSFPKPESGIQKHPKRFLVGFTLLASILKWLANLTKLTEEEREEAGVYLNGPEGE